MKDLKPDHGFKDKPVARLVAGRPLTQTPAVKGASRAHVECDVNVDSLAYWNDPQGERDQDFHSPFAIEEVSHVIEIVIILLFQTVTHIPQLIPSFPAPTHRERQNTSLLLQTEGE